MQSQTNKAKWRCFSDSKKVCFCCDQATRIDIISGFLRIVLTSCDGFYVSFSDLHIETKHWELRAMCATIPKEIYSYLRLWFTVKAPAKRLPGSPFNHCLNSPEVSCTLSRLFNVILFENWLVSWFDDFGDLYFQERLRRTLNTLNSINTFGVYIQIHVQTLSGLEPHLLLIKTAA